MTPKERAAMQQALDALEGGLWDYGPGQDEHDRCNKVITALREALAEQGQLNEWAKDQQDWKNVDGAIAWHLIDRHADGWAEVGAMMDAWRNANPAQPELNLNCKSVQKRLATSWGYAKAEQAEQEPVGRWNWNEAKFEWLTKFDYHKHHMTPLYAAPVSIAKQSETDSSSSSMRTTVRTKDLTEEDINELWNTALMIADPTAGNLRFKFARAIIAAYKEKNK